MEINYLAVLVCGVAAMVVGFVWYGPLFGKTWMRIMGVDNMTPEQKESMKKNMWSMYLAQFLLSLITANVLAYHIFNWAGSESGLVVALCTWFGFVMTTTAGACLWSGKPKKLAWKMFFIKAEALFGRKESRASFVVGCSEGDMKTLQLDGVAEILKPEEEEIFYSVYFAKFPKKREKAKDPKNVFFKFTPKWWRFTDWTKSEGKTIFTSDGKIAMASKA